MTADNSAVCDEAVVELMSSGSSEVCRWSERESLDNNTHAGAAAVCVQWTVERNRQQFILCAS